MPLCFFTCLASSHLLSQPPDSASLASAPASSRSCLVNSPTSHFTDSQANQEDTSHSSLISSSPTPRYAHLLILPSQSESASRTLIRTASLSSSQEHKSSSPSHLVQRHITHFIRTSHNQTVRFHCHHTRFGQTASVPSNCT